MVKGIIIDSWFDLQVVTGVKFTKQRQVIHIQVQQGQLLPQGQINSTTIQWVETVPIQVRRWDKFPDTTKITVIVNNFPAEADNEKRGIWRIHLYFLVVKGASSTLLLLRTSECDPLLWFIYAKLPFLKKYHSCTAWVKYVNSFDNIAKVRKIKTFYLRVPLHHSLKGFVVRLFWGRNYLEHFLWIFSLPTILHLSISHFISTYSKNPVH